MGHWGSLVQLHHLTDKDTEAWTQQASSAALTMTLAKASLGKTQTLGAVCVHPKYLL